MWPSLKAATVIFDLANYAFVVTLVVGVFATIMLVWMAKVKEAYWDEARDKFEYHVVELTADIALANAKAAEANARAAEANEKAEQERKSRIQLEARFAWRHLSDDQTIRLIMVMAIFPDLPYDRAAGSDAEALNLLSELNRVLSSPQVRWVPHAATSGMGIPEASGLIAVFIGRDIQIAYSEGDEARFGAAARTLASALAAEGIQAFAISEPAKPGASADGKLHVKVGSKPAF